MDMPPGVAGHDARTTRPLVVVVTGTLLGAVGLVSAYGVWRNQRWGVILTIFFRAVDGRSSLPGIFFAPVPWMW